jgi:hypothetical protein
VLGGEPDSLLLHDRTFFLGLVCTTCRMGLPTLRIAGAFEADQPVCACPSGARQAPIRFTPRLARDDMLTFATATWRAIGLPAEEIVTARRDGRQAHFIVGQRPRSEETTI